jgi:hypothetical protein
LKLFGIVDGKFAMVYFTLVAFIESMGLDWKKLVGIATNGASSMTRVRTTLVASLKAKNPQLVVIHCIAHCKALVVANATEENSEL